MTSLQRMESASAASMAEPLSAAPLQERRDIFQQHWWLDAVAADHWEEICVSSGGVINGVYPFAVTKAWGMKLSRMPPFTRTLGPIIDPGYGKAGTQVTNFVTILRSLLEKMPKLELISHTFNHTFTNPIGFQSWGFRVSVEPTLAIDGRLPIDHSWKSLRGNTRRLLRRGEEQCTVVDGHDPEQFAAFYLKNIKANDAFYDFSRFSPLYEACEAHRQGRLIIALDSSGRWHAAGFFVWDEATLHPLVVARNCDITDTSAMSLLYWWGIKQAHKLGVTFTEGISSLARWRFLAGFGGTLVSRLMVRKMNAPLALLLGVRSTRQRLTWSDKSQFFK